MDEATERQRVATLEGMALTLLLDRVGGAIEFTDLDYHAVLAKYGGPTWMNLHIEILRGAGREDRVRVVLSEKAPANANLVREARKRSRAGTPR